jgi:hypothetical protein
MLVSGARGERRVAKYLLLEVWVMVRLYSEMFCTDITVDLESIVINEAETKITWNDVGNFPTAINSSFRPFYFQWTFQSEQINRSHRTASLHIQSADLKDLQTLDTKYLLTHGLLRKGKERPAV